VAAPSLNLTLLLRDFRRGDVTTIDRLMGVLYPELKKIARNQFRRERGGHLLQPTALVNEAYMRLVAHHDHTWQNRAQFFSAAATAMRRILVDEARTRAAQKRGANPPTVLLDEAAASTNPPSIELVDLDRALSELAAIAPRQARIVEMRYFAGLSVPEIAEALGVTSRTVDRDWSAARVWLRRCLTQ